MEVDNLEDYITNRHIQEALLSSESVEWALNYDTKSLGKNLATAYNLNVTGLESCKSLTDVMNLSTADGSVFVTLGKLNLTLASMFYDRILPYATTYTSTWNTGGVHYEKLIKSGYTTLLKAKIQTHGSHGTVNFKTKLEGYGIDTGLASPDFSYTFVETKILNKYNDLTIYRNYNGCEDGCSYTLWYI